MAEGSASVDVFAPGTPGWHAGRRLFDASLDRRPSLVLRPHTTGQAVQVVKALQRAGEQFTLKSGGHSAAGLSVRNGVAVVDLSRLRAVTADARGRIATLESGALMADLDATAASVQMATTGGVVSHTGVVGLACGGGIGWLMGRFGLACDNIVEASIVRNAELETVDELSPDIFELRGHGTSLGFVAELKLRIHPIEPVFRWSILMIAKAEIVSTIERLSVLVASMPDTVGCSFTVLGDPDGTIRAFVDVVEPLGGGGGLQWGRAVANGRRYSESRTLDYCALQRSQDEEFSFGKRSYRRSICVDDIELTSIEELIHVFEVASSFRRSVTLDIMHGQALSRANQRKSVFVRHRYIALFVTQWQDPAQDVAGREDGRQLHTIVSRHYPPQLVGVYGNYSSEPADTKP